MIKTQCRYSQSEKSIFYKKILKFESYDRSITVSYKNFINREK